uniref:Uncharacterized protein n=1 Tax=Anser brachyrhynchus TaxID=132585 RepID=A0A8B9IA10_9AVES
NKETKVWRWSLSIPRSTNPRNNTKTRVTCAIIVLLALSKNSSPSAPPEEVLILFHKTPNTRPCSCPQPTRRGAGGCTSMVLCRMRVGNSDQVAERAAPLQQQQMRPTHPAEEQPAQSCHFYFSRNTQIVCLASTTGNPQNVEMGCGGNAVPHHNHPNLSSMATLTIS